MEQNLYFIILQRLSQSGVFTKSDISELLFDYFKNKDDIDHNWNLKSENIEKYLAEMQKVGHIEYTAKQIEKKGTATGEIKIEATITPSGLMFYYEKAQIDNLIRTDKLARKNIVITLILALASLFIGVGTFIKSIIDNDDKQHTQQLKKQLKDQNIELLKQQTILYQQENRSFREIKEDATSKKK
jgi:hypothetical protein